MGKIKVGNSSGSWGRQVLEDNSSQPGRDCCLGDVLEVRGGDCDYCIKGGGCDAGAGLVHPGTCTTVPPNKELAHTALGSQSCWVFVLVWNPTYSIRQQL